MCIRDSSKYIQLIFKSYKVILRANQILRGHTVKKAGKNGIDKECGYDNDGRKNKQPFRIRPCLHFLTYLSSLERLYGGKFLQPSPGKTIIV